jgi:glycosyltransferase involved in cell wall biosynthesis
MVIGPNPLLPAFEVTPRMQDTAKPKIIAVMPAYNAATTLERTLKDIPPGTVDEIILVDDCSRDNTVELAKSLGLTVIRHEKNTGYGGNQKTCYTAALERGADIVVDRKSVG